MAKESEDSEAVVEASGAVPKEQRVLMNPRTFEMQMKFTIDKQEYASVF